MEHMPLFCLAHVSFSNFTSPVCILHKRDERILITHSLPSHSKAGQSDWFSVVMRYPTSTCVFITHTHTHTHTHTCTHVHTHSPTHAHTHTHTHARMYTHTHAHAHTHTVHNFLCTKARSAAPHIPRVLLLGPAGSGKSLQAAQLARQYRLVDVDCKELIKQTITSGTKLAVQMKPFHERGLMSECRKRINF